MNNFLNKKYTRLILSLITFFQLGFLERTVLADEQEKNTVQYYFTKMEKTPDKTVKTFSVDSFKKCYRKGVMAPNVFDILTDGNKSNYEAREFGISGDKLYCVMTDSKGNIFHAYRELTNKDKNTLIEALRCASGK